MPDPHRTQPELNYRSRKILYAVITEYIGTAEPVGSRKLARRYGLNLSPATIRNVLSDLEEAGYLHQPHTSAGRIPTDAGYRVFIDALVQMRDVTSEDKYVILGRMQGLEPGRDDILREAGKLLSALTGAAAVLTLPRPEDEKLAQLRLIPLREGQLLAVLVTQSGKVQNRAVPAPESMDPSEIERVNNYLAELVKDRSLPEIRAALAKQMDDERGQYALLRQQAQSVLDATSRSDSDAPEVLIEGQGLLFDRPEFTDVDKIRGYLRAFEERETLLKILDRTLIAGGVQVLIGSEADLSDVQDVSVISAHYGRAGSPQGALGIIGPTRMDYAKVVPLVGFTAQCMSELLGVDGKEERG